MSNLLKSKFIIGLMMVIAFAFVANTTFAAITSTLKFGSRGAQVTELQQALNVSPATGYFGNLTKAAVKAFQANNGLVADGIFGAKSRAALSGGTVVGNLPTGCTSTIGFSPTTGMSCASGVVTTTTLPAGCASTIGYSSTTGALCATGVVTTNPTGPLAVALATDNPASSNVVSGQALADLAHFTFSGTGTLTQVTLQRTGLSVSGDIANAYLFDGNQRLTDGASVNTNGQIVFSGLNIPVSGIKTLSVRFDMASSTTSVSLGVNLISYMVSGSTTAVTTNVVGNLSYVSTAPTGSTVATLNTNTVTGTINVNAGSLGYTVWSAPLQISGRSAYLKGANFRVIGSAPTDAVQNIKLYVDGLQVGNAVVPNASGYAFFDLGTTPYTLTTGSHTIDIRGDIQKGSNRTVQFSIQNAADLMIVDSQLNMNIAVTNAVTNGSAATININSGTVSVVVDPTFTSLSNITGGATNTTIAKYKFHGYGEDVKVQTLSILPAITNGVVASGSTTNFNNVTLFFNGSQVGSSKNFTGTKLDYTLGSSLIVPAGVDSYLEVRGDLQNDTSYNYTSGTIVVTLIGSATINNGQGMNSLDSTIDVPATGNGTTTGVATTGLAIQTGSLATAKNTAYSAQTLNPNTQNAKIASFILQNQSTSEAVRVTNLAVNLALTTAGSTNYSNLRTSESSGSGSTPINPATASAGSTSSNNFSVNFQLAPGATQVLDIFADLGAAASGSVIVSLTPTALGVSSNVNVSPSAAQGQTITLGNATFQAPVLVTSSSTAQQNVAAANGSTDGTHADFTLSASGGTANVIEAKFAVRGSSTISGLNTVAAVRVGTVSAPIVLATTNTTTLGTNGPNLTDSVTTVVLTAGAGVMTGSILTVGTEDMLVTVASGTPSFTVTRGYNGTTAAAHTDGDAVSIKNGVAYLTGLNVAVPNGSAGTTISAYPTYSAVGLNGVASGSLSQLSLSYLKYTVGGTTKTMCVAGCNDNQAEIAAPTMQVVGSKPTITVASPTGVVVAPSSTVEAIDVTITADASGPIKVVSIPITTTIAGLAATTNNFVASGAGTYFVVKDASNNTISTVTGGCTSTTACTNGTLTLNGSDGYLINAGQSQTFKVSVRTGAYTIPTTQLPNTYLYTTIGGSGTFSWLDTAGSNSSAITGTSYIYNYPDTTTASVHN